MKLLRVSLAACVPLFSVIAVHALQPLTHVVHESRSLSSKNGWVEVERASSAQPVNLSIGLVQRNLHRAEELMLEVSHPKSAKYGHHWRPQEVIDMFAPSADAVSSTVQWLVREGVAHDHISMTAGRNWIKVNSTIGEAERLLHAVYNIYQNENGLEAPFCNNYSVPADIQQHIDMITPTIHFDATRRVGQIQHRKIKREIAQKWHIHPSHKCSTNDTLCSLAKCADVTTPACVRALYGMPDAGVAVEGNSYGILELSPQSFAQSDLDLFFSQYTTLPNGTAPTYDAIDGGYLSNDTLAGTREESNLDLSYALTFVYPQNVTLYQTGDGDPGSQVTYNNFLDAIDGSYCTYDGGDSPTWDASYPDTNPYWAYAYTGPAMCGTYNATRVISGSYGSTEKDRPESYYVRECNEYMKLGLMGVSVIFASGDWGVAGVGSQCPQPDGSYLPPIGPSYNGSFNPIFPASCPWVTAVGATALPQNGSINDPEVAAYDFASGGGFSNYFSKPAYQDQAIEHYYTNHAPPYNSSVYNNSQEARGYPDVAVNGHAYAAYADGNLEVFSGTSPAAPTFGSMITLINGERIKAGKRPIGFLNSVLYAHPEIFNDITVGNNVGCGTDGFSAVPGWDPVTGLGTPNYHKLRDVLLNYP